MKIRVIPTGEIIEVNAPYMEVRDGMLYNRNTEKYEAVSGDVIFAGGKKYHILKGQYTNYQIIPCVEAGDKHCIILTAANARNKAVVEMNYIKEVS